METAGYPDTARQRIAAQSLSRLETAALLNQVMLDIEDAGIEVAPELLDQVRELSLELRDEIAFLQVQQELAAQKQTLDSLSRLASRPKISGRLRFYAERQDGELAVAQAETDFYGPPPKTTKILLAQELALEGGLKISPSLEAYLSLRNFGFWGVGKYSSGSTGINFTTAGPLYIEQAWASWRSKGLSLRLGRQFLRYGPIGLLVDHRFSPILGLRAEAGVKSCGADLLLASQFEGLEYHAFRLFRSFGQTIWGGQYFFSDYPPSQKEILGIANDQGLGMDLETSLGKRRWAVELAWHKPHSMPPLLSDWHFGWAVAGWLVDNPGWRLHLNFASIAKTFPPNLPPFDRFTQDYQAGEYNRIIFGSRGVNVSITRKVKQISLETESLFLNYLGTEQCLWRQTLRFKWEASDNIYFVIEDYINNRSDKTYNQASILTSFTF